MQKNDQNGQREQELSKEVGQKIEIEKLRLTRTSLNLQIVQVAIAVLGLAIGLVSGKLLIGPSDILLLVLVFLLAGLLIGIILLAQQPATSSTELSINWTDALYRLERVRLMAEALTEKLKKPSSANELYDSLLRTLYLHAILEGRKEFAKELWEKGQLSKSQN